MEQTKTELHTHLMGILSADKFLRFLSKYTDCIFWPLNAPISSTSPTVPISRAIYDKKILDSLRIPHGLQVNYLKLNDLYATRIELLKLVIEQLTTTLNEQLADKFLDIPEVKKEEQFYNKLNKKYIMIT